MEQKKMRVSCQQGRSGAKSANHNSRYLLNLDERTHIDQSRIKEDSLFVMMDGCLRRVPTKSPLYKQIMLDTYAGHYKDHLEAQNARYHAKRQYKREKTIEELFDGKKTAPLEQILQIGKEGEFPITPQNIRIFTDMVLDYVDTLKDDFPGLIVLGFAIHTTEASLHAHLTFSIAGKDENGLECPAQDKGLKAMGIEPPHPEKPISRYNNRLQTFTSMVRERWISTIRKKAPTLQLETKPRPTKRKHLSVIDYKIMMGEETLKKMEKTMNQNAQKIDEQVILLAELDETGELEREAVAARARQKERSR